MPKTNLKINKPAFVALYNSKVNNSIRNSQENISKRNTAPSRLVQFVTPRDKEDTSYGTDEGRNEWIGLRVLQTLKYEISKMRKICLLGC